MRYHDAHYPFPDKMPERVQLNAIQPGPAMPDNRQVVMRVYLRIAVARKVLSHGDNTLLLKGLHV
jgi:hypothetical protein